MPTIFPGALDTFVDKKVIDLEDALEAVEGRLLTSHGTVRYVSLQGNDSWSGASWESAKLTVAAAVNSLPVIGSGGAIRHAGTVLVGPGLFIETATPIECNRDLRIKGMGADVDGQFTGQGTTIRLGNGRNTDLFAPTAGFTDWSHSIIFEDVALDGNKAGNTGNIDVLRINRGGFNCVTRSLAIFSACRYGLHIDKNALDMVNFDLTVAGCVNSGVFFNYSEVGATLAFYGVQIDSCGDDAMRFNCTSDGSAGNVVIQSVKAENSIGSGTNDHIIAYYPSPSLTQGFGLGFSIDSVYALNVDTLANNPTTGSTREAVIYEHSGTQQWGSFDLRNIRSDGYTKAFKSLKVAYESSESFITSFRQNHFSHGTMMFEAYAFEQHCGGGTPEGAVTAPPGSVFHRHDGGAGTSQYVKETGTGNTGWVALATGSGLRVKEGTNAKQGVATLAGGTATVPNTSVTATSRILLTVQSLGTVTVPKAIAVTARTAGTNFVITSADATDTSVVAWEIFEVAA